MVHKGAAPVVTRKTYSSFLLPAEYSLPTRTRCRIGVHGLPDVQLLDDFAQAARDDRHTPFDGGLRPTVRSSRQAGPWQAPTSRVLGRLRTVDLYGVKTSDRTVLEGLTAAATDWREDEPSPITSPRDHGIVEFRNMMLTPVLQ